MSGESNLGPAPEPSWAPGPEQTDAGMSQIYSPPSILAFPNGDEFVSSCANSSSPICYNTSISGANIITNLWFSSILGLVCYLGFVAFRGKFRLYQARLSMPTVTHKPPALRLHGLYRWWSWLIPVFTVSDEELVKSSGMDALIAVRVLSFGILVLLPITIAAMAILIPINYTDNYYKKSSQQEGIEDEYSTVFIRLTMSNITPGSSVLWVHFVFVYGAIFWTCWLITEQYKEYISLRQAYVIRNTEASTTHIGGSVDIGEKERQPLITSRGSHQRGFETFQEDGRRVNDGVETSPDDLQRGKPTSPRRNSLEYFHEMREASLKRNNTPLRILYGDTQGRQSCSRSVSFHFDTDLASHSRDFSESSSVYDVSTSDWTPETSFSSLQHLSEERRAEDEEAARRVTISEQWVDHDFSADVIDGETPEVTSHDAVDVQPGHGRMNSAAVAAALEYDFDASAATALAKIRHHRAASGASSNTSATPSKSPRASPKKVESSPIMMGTIMEKRNEPDGLVEIITLVAEEQEDFVGNEHTELPTALALHPSMCDPIGQQGISHHWWSYMAEVGSGKIGKGREKDALRKAFVVPDINIQPHSSVADVRDSRSLNTITVNASLYTVLVTDEPIEKLRLKKPFRKSREFWQVTRRKSQIEAIDSDKFDCASQKASSINSKKNSTDTHILAIATKDLEQGDVTRKHCHRLDQHASKSASERGIGITSGWSSTVSNLKQWWKHRGRYREWRRDVRWAMFHRRARVATKMFTDLFGEDFDGLIPIYPTQSVDKLITKWDKACAKLERAQYDLKVLIEKEQARKDLLSSREGQSSSCLPACLDHDADRKLEQYSKKLSCLKKKIAALNAETLQLQDDIAEERESILSDLPSTCFFATFKSQEAAAIAAQANLNPIKQRLLNVQPAPSPDDVNWPALTRSWWQRQSRPILVLPLILFIMLLPIGAFTGAFAQLTIAVCGNRADGEPASTSWYCSDDSWANFFRNLVTSLAPTLLLSLYHMCILPVLVYYAAQAEGQHFSLSSLDRRCCSLFYYWDVFNVFLGAMLGGSVIAELPTYIQRPSKIWNALSAAIPASSNFFINYVAYRALVMAWFRLWYPHMGTTVSFLKWIKVLPWAKSPREKALESPIRNCRYGRDIGIPVLMNFVMVLAYCVVSPLILPFGLLYFVFLWAVWRYQMLYVYQRQYESGGQFWPLVAHRVVGCLFICVLFTSVVLILKEAYTQAVLMLVSLPLYLLRFDQYISSRYDAVVAQVPLMAVHKAGRVDTIDPVIWTPPPLREGAEGWNPQWGMCWTFWGVPRYTI